MHNNYQNSSSSATSSSGIGFAGLLAILFIALKLLGYITWSWLWVLSPIWISAIIVLLVWAIFLYVFITKGWW